MTKFLLSAFFAFVLAAGLTSCDSTTDPTTSEPTVLKFSAKKNGIFKYDSYIVDTSDAAGNNPDRLIPESKVVVTESVTDTGVTYDGRSNCTIVSSGGDSIIYSQDANGDLYRYNFGFDYLNSFPLLVLYVGHEINVKWVLVAKLTDQVGQTWVAAKDSVFLASNGTYVYLQSNATQKADTTIEVMGAGVRCKHVQHVVTATATLSTSPLVQANGKDVVDTYISAELGSTVWDYFRSATVSGAINAKAQGLWKIMTSHP
ncbi:MAG TPA: hypothetical protein VIX80_05600 [Candidatus Kapabacteria bacterium]